MQALLPALERQGAEIVGGGDEQTVEARFAGAVVPFRLREKLKQVRHPLTEEERRRSWMGRSKFTLELHPSGKLSFRIETMAATWEDTDQSRLEDHVMDIAIAVLGARDCAIQAKRQAQEQLERRQEREKQRRLEVEVIQREEARWTAFVDLSRRSDEAAHLRRFLARIEAAGLPMEDQHGSRTVAEWQAWMRMKIDHADPLKDGAGEVFELLARLGP